MVNKSTNIYIKNNEQLPVTFTHWEKRETTCDVGNPGPGLGQAQTCGGVKPGNQIQTLPY